jgi:hypothetical protein
MSLVRFLYILNIPDYETKLENIGRILDISELNMQKTICQ